MEDDPEDNGIQSSKIVGIICDQYHQLHACPPPSKESSNKNRTPKESLKETSSSKETLHSEKSSSDLHSSLKTKISVEASNSSSSFHSSRHVSETSSDESSFSSTEKIVNLDSKSYFNLRVRMWLCVSILESCFSFDSEASS